MFRKLILSILMILPVLLLTVSQTDANNPNMLVLFTDPIGDQGGQVDVMIMSLRFSNETGDYQLNLKSHPKNPFVGEFRICVHLFNPDTGTTAANPSVFDWCGSNSFFSLSEPRTNITLSGNNPRLTAWKAGDRVAVSGPEPLGVPDIYTAFHSAVVDLSFPFPRDVIAEGEFAIVRGTAN
jgi:hypothetical protein